MSSSSKPTSSAGASPKKATAKKSVEPTPAPAPLSTPDALDALPRKVPKDRGGDAAVSHGIKRSPHWTTVRAAYIKQNPLCVACGPELDTRDHNEVHHIIPFHFCVLLGRPDLELDPRNLITLCEHDDHDHHLLIGHLNHFQSSNPDVRADAQTRYYGWTQARIEIDIEYQQRAKNRPKHWSAMSEADKLVLRKLMDDMFPPLPESPPPPKARRKSTRP